MRDLLTILAGLVIVLLVAALGVPPLVDWRSHRALFESAISHAAGMEVTTDGALDVRLLPSPRLRIERLRLGSAAPDAPSLEASFVRAEMALTPLLHGEVRFLETRVGRAEIRLPVGADGDWRVPRGLLSDPVLRREWAFEDLAIRQLLVTTIDPSTGRTDQAYAEGVAIQGQSLAGPWRLDGTSGGVPFELATGELGTDGAMSLKLSGGGRDQPRFDVDGRVQLASGVGDALTPSLAGNGRIVFGAAVRRGAGPPVQVTVTTGLTAAGRAIEFEALSLEAGEGASTLRLAGSGRFQVNQPRLSLTLDGRRFDLDAFLAGAGSKEAPKPPPPLWPGSMAIPLDLSLKLDSLALGGEEWGNLTVAGSVAAGRIKLDRGVATAPGPVQLGATGEFGTSFAAGGTGHVTLAGRSGDRLGAVLGRLGLGDVMAGLFDGRPLEAQADLVVAEPVASLRNLRVGLGDATLSGVLRYTSPDGPARGRLDAQLALQGLDLMRAPAPGGLFAAARDLDLGLILDARGVGYGSASGSGRIAARITSEGPSLRVERLEIADLAGANANVSGRIEPDGTGRIEGRVTARHAAPLLDLAGPAWLGGLSGLVPSFLREGDLDLSVMAERVVDASGPGLRTVLKGKAAGGPVAVETVSAAGQLRRIEASLAGERVGRWFGQTETPGLDRPARLRLTGSRVQDRLALTLDGDLGGAALRTTRPFVLTRDEAAIEDGAATLVADDMSVPASLAGLANVAPSVPGQLDLTFGRKDDRTQVTAKGRLAGTEIEASLSGRSLLEIDGSLRLGRLSLPWLTSALALNAPATPGGIWSSARFGAAPARTVAGRVAIRTASLDLGGGLTGNDASFELLPSDEAVAIRDLDLALAGGRIGGEVTIGRQGGLASLAGQGQIRDVSLAPLVGGAPFQGRVSAELRFGGSGESLAGILGNLGGAGKVAFADLKVAQAEPGAVARAATRALRSDDPLASGRLRSVTLEELDRGPLDLGGLAGPATLVGGVLRVGPLRGETDAAIWQGTLNLDARSLTLDARGALQAKAVPKGWAGDAPYVLLGWQGPVSRPVRTVDVGPLTNGLAAVVLGRELDRIDTFEADQNERQRRNAQRSMELERRAAAEAARQAAQRAREEAERARAAEQAAAEREQAAGAIERGESPGNAAPVTVLPPQRRPAPPAGG